MKYIYNTSLMSAKLDIAHFQCNWFSSWSVSNREVYITKLVIYTLYIHKTTSQAFTSQCEPHLTVLNKYSTYSYLCCDQYGITKVMMYSTHNKLLKYHLFILVMFCRYINLSRYTAINQFKFYYLFYITHTIKLTTNNFTILVSSHQLFTLHHATIYLFLPTFSYLTSLWFFSSNYDYHDIQRHST